LKKGAKAPFFIAKNFTLLHYCLSSRFIREISLASHFNGTKLVLLIFLLLGGCETSQNIIPTDRPGEADTVSILTGKAGGTKLSDFINKNQFSGSLPVNALLWRAALDIASFVPLDDVDTFGGSIVTEWHQLAESPDQRLKLTIFVVGLELRSDAIKVNSYLQKKRNGNWVDAGRDKLLSRKLEDLILTRARELRSSAIAKKAK
jgi:hypothetical protein